MDPNETLRLLIDAATTPTITEEDGHHVAEQVREYADALATWIERVGFPPDDPRVQIP